MAKKKNNDLGDIKKQYDELIGDVNTDREKLSEFFDKLLNSSEPLLAAEFIPKVAAELTRQNSLRANVIKLNSKDAGVNDSDESSLDDAYASIGGAFDANDSEEAN